METDSLAIIVQMERGVDYSTLLFKALPLSYSLTQIANNIAE